METEYKHWCGCITKRENEIVRFIKMCKMHKRDKNYIWIAIQHY